MNAQEAMLAELNAMPRGNGNYAPRKKAMFLPSLKVLVPIKGEDTLINKKVAVKYIKGEAGGPAIKIPKVSPSGKLLPPLVTPKMLVVIHDFWAGLEKQKPYDENNPGKPEVLCFTTSSVRPGATEDTGPVVTFGAYDLAELAQRNQFKGAIEALDDDGKPIKGEKQDCYSCKLMDRDNSVAWCKLDAPIIFTVVKVWDPEEEKYVEPKGGLMLRYLMQNKESSEKLANYVRRLLGDGTPVDGILTEISLQTFGKHNNHKLVFVEHSSDDEAVAAANKLFTETKAEWQANVDAYVAEMKAKREAEGGAKGGDAKGAANSDYAPKEEKAAAKGKTTTAVKEKPAAAAVKAAPPAPTEDDGEGGGASNDDDDCPFE